MPTNVIERIGTFNWGGNKASLLSPIIIRTVALDALVYSVSLIDYKVGFTSNDIVLL